MYKYKKKVLILKKNKKKKKGTIILYIQKLFNKNDLNISVLFQMWKTQM